MNFSGVQREKVMSTASSPSKPSSGGGGMDGLRRGRDAAMGVRKQYRKSEDDAAALARG